MTAPKTMTPEERERQTHATDRCPDSDALARFLQGPVKGAAAVESTTLEGSYDPANIQRRRWGVAPAIEKQASGVASDDADAAAAPAPSWWQKTSWFAGGVPDVAPVLADPSGGGGTDILPPAGGADTCRNRFTGPGQRDPHDPQVAGSEHVRLSAAPCEDPGEIYGGYNAAARASGGGVYVPVGGAMVHSRLSLQPRVMRVTGPRCADDFEAATRPAGAAAPAGSIPQVCAVASAAFAAARPKYGFDFERGVWEVQGTGAVVVAPPRKPREEAAPLQESEVEDEEQEGCDPDAMVTDVKSDGDGGTMEEVCMSPEQIAVMETTRGLRLVRFGAAHDAALAARADKKAVAAAEYAAAVAARANKRVAASIPLAPACRPAPQRDGAYTYQHTPSPHAEGGGAAADAPVSRSEDWQMLRLTSGDVVFFGAPDASPERVAAWISGDTPWPEVRVMELSRRERSQLAIPSAAPGPLASDDVAEAAREELRGIAAEAAAADAAAAETAAAAAEGGESKGGAVRLPPGSTATPQQANIIEQLVNATGASKEALSAADAAGGTPADAAASAKAGEVAALQETLRGMIREKHAAVVAARAAEARVFALEAAMAAAGVSVPPV